MATVKQYSIATAAALVINAAAAPLKSIIAHKFQMPPLSCDTFMEIGTLFEASCVSSALSVLGSQLLTNSGTDKSITDYAVNVGTSVMSSGLVSAYFLSSDNNFVFNTSNPFCGGLKKVFKSKTHKLSFNEQQELKCFAGFTAIDAIGAFLTNLTWDYLTKNDSATVADDFNTIQEFESIADDFNTSQEPEFVQ
jgi:hypothetical protein